MDQRIATFNEIDHNWKYHNIYKQPLNGAGDELNQAILLSNVLIGIVCVIDRSNILSST